MISHWYIIQVISGQEKKIKKVLEDNRMSHFIEEVVVPLENIAEVKKGERKITEKRLWPGYVLIKIKMTDEGWLHVKNTNGVIDFMGKGKPVPLSESEVSEILKELQDRKGEVVHKYKIAPGDHVKIVDGVFVNFVGTVLEVSHEKGRLSAMISIFGRETRVDDLEFWQVEEASKEMQIT